MCKWFCKHRGEIPDYSNEKNAKYKHVVQLWLHDAAILAEEQQKSLDKLKCNLFEIVISHRIIFEETDDEHNYIKGVFVVTKANAFGRIQDYCLFYQNIFEGLPPLVQKVL